MSLTKKNEILAKFDGWKKPARHFYHPERNLTTYELKYHQSYDWLFDVWIKFRDLELKGLTINQVREFVNHKIRISDSIPFSDIINLHEIIYEAIEWYNSIKKEENV